MFFLTAVRPLATDDLYTDHSPLARLSLDRRFASNVTKLTLFATGLKLLPGLANLGMYGHGPCEPMSRCMARSLKKFSRLRELQLMVHAKCGLFLLCTDKWGPEDQLVPFRLCSESDCTSCVMLVPGLVRRDQVEWGLKGAENGPVIKFVCLQKRGIRINDIKGSNG